MRRFSVAGANDLEQGVRSRCLLLRLDGEERKEGDLDDAAGAEPASRRDEWSLKVEISACADQ